MPNALFVITGPNRLQWDDPKLEGQLDWAAPECWPLLVGGAAEEPRQHTVGYLSAEDCEIYLCERLTIAGRPLMDDRTRHLITANSHGPPLYLDLAVMRFLDLYRRYDRAPAPGEFNLDFPALVARTFRDLTPDIRRVLRAVSLLDSFSVELTTAAAGLDHDAPALDLVERPFVDTDPAAPWRHRLHDLVRDVVREADHTSEDRWSEADWQREARRTFTALGREATGDDRNLLVAALRQGLRLARDYRLDLGWLADAAFRCVDDFVWEPVELPVLGESGDTIGTPAEALAVTLSAIAQRQREHRGRTANRLRTVLASDQLRGTARTAALLPRGMRARPGAFRRLTRRDAPGRRCRGSSRPHSGTRPGAPGRTDRPSRGPARRGVDLLGGHPDRHRHARTERRCRRRPPAARRGHGHPRPRSGTDLFHGLHPPRGLPVLPGARMPPERAAPTSPASSDWASASSSAPTARSGGDLAEVGSGAPVGPLSATAVALVASWCSAVARNKQQH